MFARSMTRQWRSQYRKLLRVAKAHDERPYLKSLLPLPGPPGACFPRCHVEAPRLYEIVRHSVRREAQGQRTVPFAIQLEEALADLLEEHSMLDANLHRRYRTDFKWSTVGHGTLHERAANHPNLAWFHGRIEGMIKGAGVPGASAAQQPWGGRRREAVAYHPKGTALVNTLQEMVAVGCTPPRRMWVKVIEQLCSEPDTFEHGLQGMRLMELETTYPLCSELAAALLSGALKVVRWYEGGLPATNELRRAAAWRAMHIFHTLRHISFNPRQGPHKHTLNRLVEHCAKCTGSREEMDQVQDVLHLMRQDSMTIFDTAYREVLHAWERIGDRKEAVNVAMEMERSGWSVDAEVLAGLYEWSLEEDDEDAASMLWEVLQETGKMAYLAARSSPQC